MSGKFMVSLVMVLGLVACKSADDTSDTSNARGIRFHTIENEGYACLNDDGTDDLSTGTVSVVLDECLSGCANDLWASCEAVVVGDSLEVTAAGEYSLPTGDVLNCPAVCVMMSTECSVSGLSGDVTGLTYADSSVGIDFPSQAQTCTND